MQFEYRPFDGSQDLNLLNLYLAQRSISDTDLRFLPPTGFVVSHEGKEVCIGFMIKCDNNMAINTDLVSDILCKKEVRQAAVEFLRELLYKEARKAGKQFVTAWTNIPAHVERLQKIGYEKIDQNLTQMGRFLWL